MRTVEARELSTIKGERVRLPAPDGLTHLQFRRYAEFGVETSAGAVLHPRAWTTPMRPGSWPVVAQGLRRGGRPYPTGGETVLGLPADFLIDPGGQILSHRYGRHAGDQWEVDELLLLAARARRREGRLRGRTTPERPSAPGPAR
ncbi:hypothetical protein [Nonomuraea dietziae]|uniref:hypothetical protein n=1 Tax=Nonomuraea dietziae TaxID=65515 RepID=UPI0033F69356